MARAAGSQLAGGRIRGSGVIVALILLLLSGCAARFQRSRHGFDPVVLLTAVWACVLLIHAVWQWVQPEVIQPLSDRCLAIVGAGIAAFVIGDLAASRLTRARPLEPGRRVGVPPVLDTVLLVIPFVALPFFVVEATRLASQTGGGSFLKSLRWQLTINGQSYGLLAYLVPVAVFSSWRQLERLAERPGDRRAVLRVAGVLAATLVIHVLMTGRTYLALLLIFLATSQGLGRRRVKGMVVGSLALFAVVFAGFAVTMSKGGSPEAGLADNVAGVSTSVATYAIGGVRALDLALDDRIEVRRGRSTRFVHAVGHRLGLVAQPPPSLVQPEVEVPFRTNVYTIFGTYLPDLGLAFTLLLLAALGAAHGVAFRRARAGGPTSTYVAALMTYPLILWFFQDQYLSLTSTWIQYALLYVGFFSLGPWVIGRLGRWRRAGEGSR